MARTNYLNGDEITLPGGCNGCSPVAIDGILCHERGCPDAWRDHPAECRECDCEFMPESRWDSVCPDCLAPPDMETETGDE